MAQKPKSKRAQAEQLLTPREAALELRISFPTIKQWIYSGKMKSVKTAGGHHRIPQSEVDRFLFRTRAKTEPQRDDILRRVSGRNQLVGRIEEVRTSGLMAEVKLSIGNQRITAIITASSARDAAQGGSDRGGADQGNGSDDSAGVRVYKNLNPKIKNVRSAGRGRPALQSNIQAACPLLIASGPLVRAQVYLMR